MIRQLALLALILPCVAIADPANAPLTRSQLKSYLKTEIAIDKVQMNMKAHADQYDNVIQAFYAKRKAMLKARGWSVDQYEATQQRISNAISAMEMEADLENDDQIAQIRNDAYMPDDQKQAMIDAIRKSHEQQRQQMINPTRPDWPAVKSYRDKLQQLTDWYAGNIPNPPQVD